MHHIKMLDVKNESNKPNSWNTTQILSFLKMQSTCFVRIAVVVFIAVVCFIYNKTHVLQLSILFLSLGIGVASRKEKRKISKHYL